jgi:hypothetical protein
MPLGLATSASITGRPEHAGQRPKSNFERHRACTPNEKPQVTAGGRILGTHTRDEFLVLEDVLVLAGSSRPVDARLWPVQGVVGVTRLDVAREDVCSRLNMAARGTGRIFGDRANPCRMVPGSKWATI